MLIKITNLFVFHFVGIAFNAHSNVHNEKPTLMIRV